MVVKQHLTLEETRQMLLRVCQEIEAGKDLLTRADRAIGDGDHGVGMARGFAAARAQLEVERFSSIDELLRTVGQALMSSAGGASGAIFGTLFRSAAAGLGGAQTFGSAELACFLRYGLQGVKDRGKARVGDKTVVDTLEPAAQRAAELADVPLDQSLREVLRAAEKGMEATRDMVASVGKAKTLGERALGHADPGAISFCLLLQAMAHYVTGGESR
jgi:dihydroxyacetone kinase-like protein